MTTAPQNENPTCFSGILGRILCGGSVPTHPSDQINDNSGSIKLHFTKPELEKTEPPNPQILATKTPGVVARLMGLDSLPTDIHWAPKQTTLGSFLRSRSVNSLNYLPEFNLSQAQHRRVRTSVSFREVPNFLHQEQSDLLVFCFEKPMGKTNNNETFRVSEKESERGFEEMKVRGTGGSRNKERMGERVVQNNRKMDSKKSDKPNRASVKSSSPKAGNVLMNKKDVHGKPPATPKSNSPTKPMNKKQSPVRSESIKKIRKNQLSAKKVVPECPISVFDISEFPISESPLRASPEDDAQELRTAKNKAKGAAKTREAEYCKELSSKICSLTEKDMEKSNWIAKDVLELDGCGGLCIEFGQQVLEQLLNQMVDELVGLQPSLY